MVDTKVPTIFTGLRQPGMCGAILASDYSAEG